ncbi:MAG: hypothetical protein IME96_09940, partial [Proteobacteria bacterium]|nr:hypothetical protein [Pseudomonadota bacterium]
EWDSRDVSLTEAACLVPLALLVLYLGLFPSTFLNYISPTSKHIVEIVEKKHAQTLAMEEGQLLLQSKLTEEVAHD